MRGVSAARGGGELRLILFVGSMKVKTVCVWEITPAGLMSRPRAQKNVCLIMRRVQMWQIHTDTLLIGCYLHPPGSLYPRARCKHAFTVTMTASDRDSMSGLLTSAQESFSVFPSHGPGPSFLGSFHSLLCVFSGWKDAFCPLSASRVETHKRCWPHGVHLGFQVPSLGSFLP